MKKQKAKVAVAEPEQPQVKKRCGLCPDGGEGKALVQVVDAVRQKKWACVSHAAFYGRERTGVNRKYLPGNEPQPVGARAAKIEVAKDAGVEEPRSPIKVRDRK